MTMTMSRTGFWSVCSAVARCWKRWVARGGPTTVGEVCDRSDACQNPFSKIDLEYFHTDLEINSLSTLSKYSP